jgi:hypothetical protein
LRQSVPGKIDALYVASKLNMSEISAKSNVLRALRTMGLIDGDSKPTPRALRWRDDAHYREVCEEIAADIYDQELLAAFPGPEVDRHALQRWFALRASVGESAAKQMAALYSLLAAGDPSGQDPSTLKSAPKNSARRVVAGVARPGQNGRQVKPPPEVTSDNGRNRAPDEGMRMVGPSLHIDVQVHISPDATADQIDAIFASMSKHLYESRQS